MTAPPTTPLHVLIVEDDTLVGLGLKSTLTRLGHHVTAHAATPAEALQHLAADPPDLVLLDIRLSSAPDNTDGLSLAAQLATNHPDTPIIILTAYSDPDLIRRATASPGVFGYLVKPVTAETLAAQIEVAITRAHDQELLRDQTVALTTQLETRKLVERAKGILMKRLNLTEAQAHRRLQLDSQSRRLSLCDLAKKILESDDLLNP